MLSLFALMAAAPSAAVCPGTSTIEVNACLDATLKQSDGILNRYYRVALQRITRESGSKTAQQFVRAERSWLAYRDSECGSVFDYWSGGTIRASMELDCRIRLTRLRTYTIWRDWLTYADSTPPLLPRPEVGPISTER